MLDFVKTWVKKSIPLSILVAGFVIAGLIIALRPSAPKLPPQEIVWPIEAEIIAAQNHQPEILLHGRVESKQTTTLKGAVTAYVAATPALEGEVVKKDELLVQLNPIDAQLLLAQREAEVKRIESELLAEQNRNLTDEQSLALESELVELLTKSVQREQKLSKQSLASQARVEEAELAAVREKLSISARELALKNYDARIKQLEANHARAKADRDLAKLNVERTNIQAPFAGIISKRFVSIGDRVGANDSILEMYSLNDLEIRAQLSTERMPIIQEALETQASLSATIIGRNLEALDIRLDRIAGEIELDEGGIDALFSIESPTRALRIGQAVKLVLRLPARSNTLMIPSTALYETENDHFIYQVVEADDGMRLKALSVDLIGVKFIDNKTYMLVTSPIEAEAVILTTRLPYARDGLKVERRVTS